jgi:ATP-dependent DNA ligase
VTKGGQTISNHNTQKASETAAIKAGHRAKNEGGLGQAVLHKADGGIREERTYGADPAVGRVKPDSQNRDGRPMRHAQVGFLPCIPTHATKVPAGPDWIHEIKQDGYRLIVQRQVGPELFRVACDMHLEGLVSKHHERPPFFEISM